MKENKKKKFPNTEESQKFDNNKEQNQEPFPTLEDVPYSWDGDQEPKMVPMCSQWPYLSFAKILG